MRWHFALLHELRKCCGDDALGVDQEMASQGCPGVGHAPTVGAKRGVVSIDPLLDLIGDGTHVIGDGNDAATAPFKCLPHVGDGARFTRCGQVVAIAGEAVAP